MNLKVEHIDMSEERRILSNMIMSTNLLATCVSIGKPYLFESSLARIVAGWLWEYWDKIGAAPGKTIMDIYRSKVNELSEADASMVYTYLSTCSDEWLPTNEAYSEKMAVKYFQLRALADLATKLQDSVKYNDISKGLEAVSRFVKPEIVESTMVDMFRDSGVIHSSFEDTENEVLFTLPSELGIMCGPIIRGDFVAIAGPPKSSKTWWLMTCAFQAALQGRNVLYLSLEMTEPQMVRRFWQMFTATSRYGETAPYPVFKPDGDKYYIEDQTLETNQVDTSVNHIKETQKILRKASRSGSLKLKTYPTGLLSISKLKADLKDLEVYDNFVPEVIVSDYADLMQKPSGNMSERDKINDIWLSYRGISRERECALITASQTNRSTVDGKSDVSGSHLSDDIRKLAHVTKLITLNQTKTEKSRGLYRLEISATRDGAPYNGQVICTSCLAIGRPYLEMKPVNQVNLGTDEYVNNDETSYSRKSRKRDIS